MPSAFHDAVDQMASDLRPNTVKDTLKDTRCTYHDTHKKVTRVML